MARLKKGTERYFQSYVDNKTLRFYLSWAAKREDNLYAMGFPSEAVDRMISRSQFVKLCINEYMKGHSEEGNY